MTGAGWSATAAPLPGLAVPARVTGNGDGDLELVAGYLLAEDPQGRRFAAALRRTIDMLLDGQHTGRYR